MNVLQVDTLELEREYLKKKVKERCQECKFYFFDEIVEKDINEFLKTHKNAEVKHLIKNNTDGLLVVFEYQK